MVKKKVKKKAGKKKKASAGPEPYKSVFEGFDKQDYDLVARTLAKKDWVYVDVKQTPQWVFADFTVCLRTCTPLSTIAQKIKERHGRIAELKLYRYPAHEKTQLTDMNATLGDLGVVGGAKTDEERTTILYKFRPGLNGPLLLKEPELMLPEFLDPSLAAKTSENKDAVEEVAT